MQDMHRTKCEYESDYRWHEECLESFSDFFQRKDNTWIHVIHDKRYTEDGTDERMWAGCWESQIPCPEIPDDGSYEKWEYHTDTECHRGIRKFLKWEELHDTDGDSCPTDHHTEEVEECSKENSFLSRKRVGIDDWCNGIGCIMETIDELKCAHKEETETSEEIGVFHRKILDYTIL